MQTPALTLLLTLAPLALSACYADCRSVCELQATCFGKLHLGTTDVEGCTGECQADDHCLNKTEVLDCLASVTCEDATRYSAQNSLCYGKCQKR